MPNGSLPVIGEERLWLEHHFIRLKLVLFARCIFLAEEGTVPIELHTFADVSEEACAVLLYTRAVNQDG